MANSPPGLAWVALAIGILGLILNLSGKIVATPLPVLTRISFLVQILSFLVLVYILVRLAFQ